jgi:integrase
LRLRIALFRRQLVPLGRGAVVLRVLFVCHTEIVLRGRISLCGRQPCAYIDAAGIAEDRKGWLFRTSPRHTATVLTEQPMAQADAWRMIRRRAVVAGIHAPIGNHTFRATGITAYLGNGGALEHAQSMAAHESPRTTKLYDRTQDRLTQDEVERIRL